MKIIVHNYIETMVQELLPRIIDEADMCDCIRCKTDVLAISLNNVKPRYVVSEKGELYTKLDTLEAQNEADVVKEMAKACYIVKNNPRH